MSKMRFAWWVCSLSGLLLVTGAQADNIRLDEGKVVSLAADHNPGLKSTRLQLESQRWDVAGLESQYAPVIVFDASGTQSTIPSLLPTGINVNRTRRADAGAELRKHLVWGTDLTLRIAASEQVTSFTQGYGLTPPGSFGPGYGAVAKLTLKQPLMRGRGRDISEANLQASRAQRTVQEHARDRIASELVRDALTAYWELWYADAALHIEEQSRDVAMRQRDEASARARGGALAPADVLPLDTQVATREESVLDAQVLRQQREFELLTRLGVVQERPHFEVNDEDVPLITSFSPDRAAQRAIAESAQLKELEAQVTLARVQAKSVGDPLRPRLDLDSYVQTQGLGNKSTGDAAQQFVSMDVLSGFVGLTYELPLSSKNQHAQVAKARLAIEIAEQQLVQAREQVLSNVGLLLERQSAGERKVDLAERTLEIAQRQQQAEQARFDTGTSTPLNVLEAEDAVRSAKLRVARARADLVESALSLQHLTGELLDRYAAVLGH